jgi:hypothetical protein
MKLYIASAICGLSMSLTSCAPKGAEYIPESHAGDRYEYSFEYAAPFLGTQKASMVARTEGEENINGKTFHKFVIVVSGIPGADDDIEYRRWTPQGVYYVEGSDKTKTEYMNTVLPLEMGTSWTVKKPTETVEYTVTGIENIETPAGTFDKCLKIDFKGDKSEGTQYLAPNVGLVKQIAKASGIPMTVLLTKYKK